MSTVPRTLIICHKQLGDVLLLEPSLAKIREATGGPIEILTRSGHAPLLRLVPGLTMAGRTWLRKYDAVFCYDADRKSVIHAALTLSNNKRAILRVDGDLVGMGRRVFHHIHAPGLGDTYVARYNWDNTRVSGSAAFRPPTLTRPPADWKPVDLETGNYLLLNATAGWKRKRWKTGAWNSTLDGLPDIPRIVITSGGQDWQVEQAKAIADHLGPRAIFLGGRTRLEEFLWLVANARMVLGVDGAAAHLAAAFGVPNVTLFLTTNPANWHFPTDRSVALEGNPAASGDERDREIAALRKQAERLWQR